MASYIFGTFLTLIGPKRENSLNLLSLMAYTVEAMIHLQGSCFPLARGHPNGRRASQSHILAGPVGQP